MSRPTPRSLAALAVLLLASGVARAEDEIVGLGAFGGSARARAVLEERGFVVTEETRHQIFSFYVHASRVFVTTDALLHTYFANVEESMAKLRRARASALVRWIDAMRAKLDEVRAAEPPLPENWRDAADAVADYLLIAHALARGLTEVDASDEVRRELARILEAGAPGPSPLRGIILDYRRFRPSGFTAQHPRFHRAVTWLHEVSFRVSSEAETRQAVILTAIRPDGPGADEAAGIYSEFLGASDDPGPRTYADLVARTGWKAKPLWTQPDRWARFRRGLERLPAPRMTTTPTPGAVEDPGTVKGLRLLPRPLLFDNEVLREVTPFGLDRPPASGLELFAAMGCSTARHIVENREGREIEGYGALLEKATRVAAAAEIAFDAPLCQARRRVLRTLFESPEDETLPAYIRHPDWRLKDLNTALAGWAHHRYVWDVHAKRHMCYGGDVHGPRGVVEPNEPFFAALQHLSRLTARIFDRHGLTDHRFDDLAGLIGDLRRIVACQREGRVLGDRLEGVLDRIGPRLGGLCGFTGNSWLVDSALPDHTFAVPVSLRLDTDRERWVGQSRPRAIYVVIEQGGRRFLATGGVLSYREMSSAGSGDERLSNDRWREEVADRRIPPAAWQESLEIAHTEDELLDHLRRGEVVPVLARRPTPAVGEVLAEMLAGGDDFRFRGARRPSDRARALVVHLFAKTGHPRLVEVLFSRLARIAVPGSEILAHPRQCPEADVLQGRLDATHLPELLRLAREGHTAGHLLMALAASIGTEEARTAVLDHVDAKQSLLADRHRKHRAEIELRLVLDALLTPRDLATARVLLGRSRGFVDPARTVVDESLRRAWPQPVMTVGSVTVHPGRPRPPDYTDEEKAFAEDLWRAHLRRKAEQLRRRMDRGR
jgi:hypothetical protein